MQRFVFSNILCSYSVCFVYTYLLHIFYLVFNIGGISYLQCHIGTRFNSLKKYIYIYIYIYTVLEILLSFFFKNMHIHIYIYLNMYIYLYRSLLIYRYIYIGMHIYIYIFCWVSGGASMHIYIYIIYLQTYTYTFTLVMIYPCMCVRFSHLNPIIRVFPGIENLVEANKKRTLCSAPLPPRRQGRIA